jgi:hypothetical protein
MSCCLSTSCWSTMLLKRHFHTRWLLLNRSNITCFNRLIYLLHWLMTFNRRFLLLRFCWRQTYGCCIVVESRRKSGFQWRFAATHFINTAASTSMSRFFKTTFNFFIIVSSLRLFFIISYRTAFSYKFESYFFGLCFCK